MTSILRTTLLLALLTGLLLMIGGAIAGRAGLLIALLLSVIMNIGSYWYSDKIVLRMYNAREVQASEAPQLCGIVQRLAERADLPMPKVYIIPSEMPNAFATGRDPKHAAVAVTTGIMKILDYSELEGVLGHELTHVKNRDTLISAATAGVITYLASIAQWSLILGGRDEDDGNMVGLLLMAVLAPFAALLIQLAISRGREFAADEGGARLCGRPAALASALAKLEMGAVPANVNPSTAHMFIVNPLKGQRPASLISTHPGT